MNGLLLLVLADVSGMGWAFIGITVGVVVFVIFAYALAKRYVKVGPNEVLIIFGRRRRMPLNT